MNKLTFAIPAALLAVPAANPVVRQSHAGVTIVTLNMAMETSAERVLREWKMESRLHGADIFLLQEIKEEEGSPCVAKRLGDALGMHVVYSPEGPGVLDRGLAILSRYPLKDVHTRTLRRFDLRFHSRNRFALSAVAETPWGPLRVDDVHLDTRLNAADRIAQLEPLLTESANYQGRRIIAGDFNSNPFYWVEHVLPLPSFRSQASTIDRFMKSQGLQTAIEPSVTTSDFLGMHLDWIWMAGLRSTSTQVLPLDFSDHHAVWTQVEFE